MDPVSIALLAAAAGGAGGEAGRQAWSSLAALVRRPFRLSEGAGGDGEDASEEEVEAQLASLEQHPDDRAAAQELSQTLLARATADPEFETDLTDWVRSASALDAVPPGAVRNEITGGHQYGPVLQGQSFSGLSFTVGAPPPPSPQEADAPPVRPD